MSTLAFILEGPCLFYFCLKINHLKITLLNIFLFSSVIDIVTLLMSLFTNDSFFHFLVVPVVIIYLLYRKNNCFYISIFLTIVSFLIYFSFALPLNSIINQSLRTFVTNNTNVLFIGELSAGILPIYLLGKFFPNFSLHDYLKKLDSMYVKISKRSQFVLIATIVFDLLSLLGLFYDLIYLIKTEQRIFTVHNQILIALFFLLLGSLLLQLFLVKHYLNWYKYQKTAFENESLKIYTTNLESSYRILQEFRHDYIGILSSLEYGIENNDLAQIKRVFYSTIMPSKDKVVESRSIFIKLSLLREDVKSFLVHKISDIISKKINIDLMVTTDLKDCEIESIDLVRIFSILLDNALEEAEIKDNSFIKIMILSTTEGDEIKILNSLNSPELTVNKVYEKDFSTKEKHSGLGLYTVKKIIGKYDNLLLETTIESDSFIQKISISRKQGEELL